MGALLILSLAANFGLGILFLVRGSTAADRAAAAELSAAIGFALDELSHFYARKFLRQILLGHHTDFAAIMEVSYPGWSEYRDRHMAKSLGLSPKAKAFTTCSPNAGLTYEVGLLSGRSLTEAVDYWKRMVAEGFTNEDSTPPTENSVGIFARDAEGKTHGMAVYHEVEGEDFVWLYLLYVEPQFRRSGLGRHLVSCVRQAVANVYGKPLKFGTFGNNIPMRHLAAECGYVPDVIFYREDKA